MHVSSYGHYYRSQLAVICSCLFVMIIVISLPGSQIYEEVYITSNMYEQDEPLLVSGTFTSRLSTAMLWISGLC